MTKNIIKVVAIVVAGVGVAGVGCGREAAEQPLPELALDSVEKKVSYVVGYDTARRMRAEGFALDAEVIAAAVEDLNSGRDAKMTDEEMQAAMTAFQTQIQEKRQAQFNLEAEQNLKRGQEFLVVNGEREGVVTTESGLQYEILTAGTGNMPSTTDEVSVNYQGSLITGEVFDSGEGVTFRVDQLIPAWVEALPRMKVGAKWKLFVPADLAYGPGGTGNIGPNSTLIFDMELLSIEEQSE